MNLENNLDIIKDQQTKPESEKDVYKEVMRIPSSSNPKKSYVIKERYMKFSCNCPSWIFKNRDMKDDNRNCKHIEQAMKKLGIHDSLSFIKYFGSR